MLVNKIYSREVKKHGTTTGHDTGGEVGQRRESRGLPLHLGFFGNPESKDRREERQTPALNMTMRHRMKNILHKVMKGNVRNKSRS